MSGSIIPVKVGKQATQLSGSTPDDYTIYNTDTTDSVWIANSNSVLPGLGMRLGPLGTLDWQKKQGLAFACVDTDVISDVLLNVSNDINNIVNPVDVAAATAIEILAHGVPNVILVEQLFSGPFTGTTGALDVTNFASVTIDISASATVLTNTVISVNMQTAASSEVFNLSIPFDPLSGKFPGGKWEIPVTAATVLTITSPTAVNVVMVVQGSNREVAKLRQLNQNYMPRIFNTGVVAFVAGTAIQMPCTDGTLNNAGADNVTRFNGPVKVVVFANAAAIAAKFHISMAFASFNQAGIATVDNANLYPDLAATTYLDWYHPPIPVQWKVTPAAAGAACQVSIQVVPAGSGL